LPAGFLSIDDALATWGVHLHIPDRRNEVETRTATALVHGLMVVTRNVKEFDGTGAIIVGSWLE
jgi:hypothetical protein